VIRKVAEDPVVSQCLKPGQQLPTGEEPAQQIELHRLTGDLPARRSAWTRAALTDTAHARAFWVQLQSVRSTPKIPEWERIASKVSQYVEAAVRDELTIDEALTRLDGDVDAILEKRRWLLR